jgi:hypothetical protein
MHVLANYYGNGIGPYKRGHAVRASCGGTIFAQLVQKRKRFALKFTLSGGAHQSMAWMMTVPLT